MDNSLSTDDELSKSTDDEGFRLPGFPDAIFPAFRAIRFIRTTGY